MCACLSVFHGPSVGAFTTCTQQKQKPAPTIQQKLLKLHPAEAAAREPLHYCWTQQNLHLAEAAPVSIQH